ncbi:MAG: DUF420 domain-containing protein [Myxococcota bacterium]
MNLPEYLACLNACLNATSGILLSLAYVMVKKRRLIWHQRLMTGAFLVSCLFLASYTTRMAIAGDTKFLGQGPIRQVYFTILISHVTLAMAVVPLVLRTLWLAYRGEFTAHRRIARWTFPIWLYVSITGVIVYLMLYQLPLFSLRI